MSTNKRIDEIIAIHGWSRAQVLDAIRAERAERPFLTVEGALDRVISKHQLGKPTYEQLEEQIEAVKSAVKRFSDALVDKSTMLEVFAALGELCQALAAAEPEVRRVAP